MGVLRAKEAFHYPGKDGYTYTVHIGELCDSGDPCVRGRESLFETVEETVARQAGVVEDASAEPNAKRSVSTTKPVYGETHPPKPGAQALKRPRAKSGE